MDNEPIFIGYDRIDQGDDGEGVSIDPATNEPIATFARASREQADQAVAAAQSAIGPGSGWARMLPYERGRVINEIASGLRTRREEIASRITSDSGKPITEARGEVDVSARFFEFYAGLCDKLRGDSVPLGEGFTDWTEYEPLGVSVQIIPWNYQLAVAARGIAPALAAGCSVVAKPSTETPLVFREIVDICRAAGLPNGVLNVVPGRGSTIGDHLANHPSADQLTFTGSVNAGSTVMQAAARNVVPTVIELGGKSPQLLFADADLETSLDTIFAGMFTHAGQVCNAGTRLLVEDSIYDAVLDKLAARIQSVTLGHGRDDPDMGPVISKDQKATILEYVDEGATSGTIYTGTDVPTGERTKNGNFVSPTVVSDVKPDDRVVREEIFGPVLTVQRFESRSDAIEMGNDTEFGLISSVFTKNVDNAMACAKQLRTGQVYVNCFGAGLDVEFPFGGFKRSGFSREKGTEAIYNYVNLKNTCIRFA